MKKLMFFFVSAALFGCDFSGQPKDDKKPQPDIVKIDTAKHLPDVVLENPEKDLQVAMMKRKKPAPTTPPTPKFCIFLDHDGHTTTGTVWNVNGPIVSGPSGFTLEQQQEILDSNRNYWNPIAGVYVTNDSSIFLSYELTKRMRVVISPDHIWYGSSAGGIAYLNSAHWGDGTPCFVFSSLLGNSVRNVADASAHEPAHTLGLRHQSLWLQNADGSWTKTSEYNWGNGFEAPIEGASYNSIQPKWWIGKNSLGVDQNDTTVLNNSVRQ